MHKYNYICCLWKFVFWYFIPFKDDHMWEFIPIGQTTQNSCEVGFHVSGHSNMARFSTDSVHCARGWHIEPGRRFIHTVETVFYDHPFWPAKVVGNDR